MKKLLNLTPILMLLFCVSLVATTARAGVLLQDSLNYPYNNGPLAGQGKWYVYSAGTPANDIGVTNNIIYIASTNKDSIATPTNGFYNPLNGTIVYASFSIKVSKVPAYNNYNGGYFAQFLSTNGNTCCNLFISTNNTVIPGTFRLSIANFSVSFSNLQQPVTYPEDLVTNVVYNIVIAYDTQIGSTTEGANLLIDPSFLDYDNLIAGEGEGNGFVYGTDTAINTARAQIEASAIGFGPFIDAGISNVIVGTDFADVYSQASPPVFGLQPVSGTNYSGNSATFDAVAAGSDLTYQWYSTTYGELSDGANFTGSTSNILVVSSLAATDGYYVIVTDANGNTATSATAVETVNTTPTPVFFDPSVTATNVTAQLFSTVTFANAASGTGPISYQWYFQPITVTLQPVYTYSTNKTTGVVTSTLVGNTQVYTTNNIAYVPLAGQNGPDIDLTLADYTSSGFYYVVATDSVNGTSTAYGPTNALLEVAPLTATLEQLHTYLNNTTNQIAANPGGTIYINTNNVTVSGYISVYRGYGSTYSEFFLQDTNDYGVEVFLAGHGNTNTPPIGTYVTVSGELEVYHAGLELAPSAVSAIVTNLAPPAGLYPFLGNSIYTNLVANPIGSNALRFTASLVTFTNVYLYGSSTGGVFGSGGANYGVGGIFTSNSYTILYITVGAPYDAVTNNLTMEIFQPTYDYRNGTATVAQNPFDLQPIPTHVAQLTGVMLPYGGSPSYVEVIPSRYEDYMTNNPTPVALSIAAASKSATVSWTPVGGNTYSVASATNLTGPWKTEASGLTYYPTNGVYTQTLSPALRDKFYQVTSP